MCAKIVVSLHLSRTMSLAPHRTASIFSSTFSSVSHPDISAQIHGNAEVTDTDPEPLTGYEPNRIVDNQIIHEQEDIPCTEDNQITEIEGHVKTLSFNQSLLSSTQDSIESIATPQEADLEDEQFRALLASKS